MLTRRRLRCTTPSRTGSIIRSSRSGRPQVGAPSTASIWPWDGGATRGGELARSLSPIMSPIWRRLVRMSANPPDHIGCCTAVAVHKHDSRRRARHRRTEGRALQSRCGRFGPFASAGGGPGWPHLTSAAGPEGNTGGVFASPVRGFVYSSRARFTRLRAIARKTVAWMGRRSFQYRRPGIPFGRNAAACTSEESSRTA